MGESKTPTRPVDRPPPTAAEWATTAATLELSAAELAKLQELLATPKPPSTRLRAAAKRHR